MRQFVRSSAVHSCKIALISAAACSGEGLVALSAFETSWRLWALSLRKCFSNAAQLLSLARALQASSHLEGSLAPSSAAQSRGATSPPGAPWLGGAGTFRGAFGPQPQPASTANRAQEIRRIGDESFRS